MAAELPSTISTPPTSTPTPTPTLQSQPQPQPSSAPPPTTQKTPVTLTPTSHLDPSAYVRGTHSITIGPNVLIHPRAHLLSVHSPLTIGEGCIVAEKAVLGGPIPPASTSSTSTTFDPPNSAPTSIGRSVHVAPNVTINSGATVGDYVVLESLVMIGHGVKVGAHAKVCAGVELSRDVPAWSVVFGARGECQRMRMRRAGVGKEERAELDGEGEREKARLRVMGVEREGTMAILKRSAARAVAGAARKR